MSVARTRIVFAALAVAVLALVLVGIASGADHRLWEQFKQPNPPTGGSQYSRLLSVAGSHRYQYWQAALNAFDAHPWKGLGPGTFEFYWSQHNTLKEFVRNAHSLWIETMAELGVIGLLLIAGFFAVVLGAGTWRALRSAERPRLFGAAAVAGVAAFCAAAAFDWVWQIGAVPLVALLLAAVALADVPARERIGREFRFLRSRAVLALGALVSLWAILIPLATTVEVRASQAASGRGDFRTALADASTAQSLDPDAASPRLQRALLLEQLGDVSGAEQAIAAAESREAPNWRIWLVASRIATEAGHPKLALEYYRRARALNPTSFIFAG
jgi:tetratricopeptide (TPR) repeat protein